MTMCMAMLSFIHFLNVAELDYRVKTDKTIHVETTNGTVIWYPIAGSYCTEIEN